MARKKKLYLVWQSSGSYANGTYQERLCGVYDDEQQALELKSRLDLNVIKEDMCWTIMPQEVYSMWPTIETYEGYETYDGSDLKFYSDCGFEYISEYRGYTLEQREQQESRWLQMLAGYMYADVQVVNMNEEF